METVSQLKGRGQEIIQGSQKQGRYHIRFGTETPQSFRDFFSPRSFFLHFCSPSPPPPTLFPFPSICISVTQALIQNSDIYHPRRLLARNCKLQVFFFSFPLFAFLLSQRQQLTLTSCFTAWATSSCFISCCQISTNYLNSHAYHHCSVQL